MAEDAPKSPRPAGDAPAVASTDDAKASEKKTDEIAVGTTTPAVEEKSGDVDSAQTKEATNGDDDKDETSGEQPAAPSTDPAAKAPPKTPASSSQKKKGTPKPSAKKRGAATPAKKTDTKFDAGQCVIAKMRSYPPWPAIILSKELLPEVMIKGSASGGKTKTLESVGAAAWNTQYPILYMGTYEYSWTTASNLEPLTQEKIESGAGSRKTKGLSEAFAEASKGFTLDDVKEIQENTAQSAEADAEPEEEEEAEPEDEMEVDEEEGAASEADKSKKKASRGKKRKKSDSGSDDEAESEKPTKTPKKTTPPAKAVKTPKSKAATAKTPAKTPKTPANGVKASTSKAKAKETPASKAKKTAGSAKPKKSAKSKETVDSEDENASGGDDKQEVEDVKKPVDPATLSSEKQYDLMLHRRHRLQKAFLNKEKLPPSVDDVPDLSRFLTALEEWRNLSPDLIKTTKIHKVLRGIMKLEYEIPLEEEYQFKKRSEALYKKWIQILGAAGTEKTPAKPSTSEDKMEVEPAETKEETANDEEKKENGVKDDASASATNGEPKDKEAGAAKNEDATMEDAADSKETATESTAKNATKDVPATETATTKGDKENVDEKKEESKDAEKVAS